MLLLPVNLILYRKTILEYIFKFILNTLKAFFFVYLKVKKKKWRTAETTVPQYGGVLNKTHP